MNATTILIKKYENRRLYDATNSRYVNLEEVAEFVQRGCDVRVIDVASGEDITRVILTQIIAEGAKTPRQVAKGCKAGTDCGSCVRRIQALLGHEGARPCPTARLATKLGLPVAEAA